VDGHKRRGNVIHSALSGALAVVRKAGAVVPLHRLRF
jgi:hypothetical protein